MPSMVLWNLAGQLSRKGISVQVRTGNQTKKSPMSTASPLQPASFAIHPSGARVGGHGISASTVVSPSRPTNNGSLGPCTEPGMCAQRAVSA